MLSKIKNIFVIFTLTLLSQSNIFGMNQLVLLEQPKLQQNSNIFVLLRQALEEYELVVKAQYKDPLKNEISWDENKWNHEIQKNPMRCYLQLVSMYKKVNSKQHSSSIPYYISYRITPPDFFSSLKQVFSKKDRSNAKRTISTIKSDLTKLIKYVKENDLENNVELQEEINKKCKQLWNDFLKLHNHSWLDQIIYPHHPHIEDSENNSYRRKLLFSIHPDSNKSVINKTQQDELCKYLTDTSRPDKHMDFVVNPIIDAASSIGSHVGFNIFETACFLPSILFPRFFSNQETRFLKKNINQKNKEINQCDRSVKVLERNIQARHEELKKTFKFNSKN